MVSQCEIGPQCNYHKGRAGWLAKRFQPGEGPGRGLLCDYEPSDGPFLEH